MDKMLSVNQKNTNKHPKIKKKPVKVVYISNPMKVKTSASEFRALVQELTGQDADMPDPTKYTDSESVGGCRGSQEEVSTELKAMVDDHVQRPRSEMPKRGDDFLCEIYDDEDVVGFAPQMMESFSGLVPSNLWYGSTHDGDELKSLDIV
ncbi:hypothetical protein ACH5RR_007068 [Cinchona calisaya]|uniref:VQ domain-containing protein n=1 Tax=Cinchona calisaya TaxID=153742 RepID=A0ABD3AR70_9GENT